MGGVLKEVSVHKKTQAKEKKIKDLAMFMLENQKLTRQEIADQFGIPYQSLCALMRDSELLQQIIGMSRRKMVTMVPLAMQGMEDSLKSRNEKIKFMSSQEVLRSEKILGPERIDVTISDNSNRTIEELQEKIRRAQEIPSPTIDAEIIS